jgi:hypothetical protein
MVILDIWIEENLRSCLNKVAAATERNLSNITRDFILVGIARFKQGDIEITGPLETRRPFAEISFGGRPTRLAFRIDEDLLQELESTFKTPARIATRKALRLGVTTLEPEGVMIVGSLGIQRPLATFKLPEIEDEEAKKALERLRKLPQ